MSAEEHAEKLATMWNFTAGFRSAQLATASLRQTPEASYAPVLLRDNTFYVYLSQLAKHTRNLAQNPKLSLLFIEDESVCENIFARRRATFACESTIISRDSDEWSQRMDEMHATHGETVAMIRTLTDFELFACTPRSVRYVEGFAQAYRFQL